MVMLSLAAERQKETAGKNIFPVLSSEQLLCKNHAGIHQTNSRSMFTLQVVQQSPR